MRTAIVLEGLWWDAPHAANAVVPYGDALDQNGWVHNLTVQGTLIQGTTPPDAFNSFRQGGAKPFPQFRTYLREEGGWLRAILVKVAPEGEEGGQDSLFVSSVLSTAQLQACVRDQKPRCP